MFYIVIFLLLCLAVIIEKKCHNNRLNNIIFFATSSFLTIISAIRYGSGSDYFGYMWHYNFLPSNVIKAVSSESHMNLGFKVVMSGCKSIGISFEGFIFMLSVILMAIVTYLIWRNSKWKSMSLLIFYSIYFHIYVNSAIRQGVTLVIFLWAFYTYLKRDKILMYCVTIIIGSVFHYSILVVLVIPLIKIIYEKYGARSKLNILFVIIAFASLIFRFERILPIIAKFIGIGMPYESTTPSVMAILLRVIILLFILCLYYFADKSKVTSFEKFQIYTYFIGVIMFIAVSSTPELSRLTEFFSILDMFIIGNLLNAIDIKVYNRLGMTFLILIVGVIFIKDQASFINQGSYYYESVIEYPYVTVFNKRDIFEYRYVEHRYRPSEFNYWIGRYRNNIIKWNLVREQKKLRGQKVEKNLPIPKHKEK